MWEQMHWKQQQSLWRVAEYPSYCRSKHKQLGFFKLDFGTKHSWYKALAQIQMLLLINAVSDYLLLLVFSLLFSSLTATGLCSMLQT